MNYRHSYHAGSFSDVFKHVVLMTLIQALLEKEKPFCYLDTHAGIGRYDLNANEAQKSKEFQSGIFKIWQQDQTPTIVQDYLNIIKKFNPTPGKLEFYPGSPCIAQALLRPNDRMVLSELHTQDYGKLKQNFFYDKQVAVHHQDAYLALKAFLPPKERRGLVFIDPPYEKTDEFKQIMKALKLAFERWQSGIYAIWYPIKDKHACEQFYRGLKSSNMQSILAVELNIYPKDVSLRLAGSGVIIINPPWQLDKTLAAILPWLWSKLAIDNMGGYKVEWLVKEN